MASFITECHLNVEIGAEETKQTKPVVYDL